MFNGLMSGAQALHHLILTLVKTQVVAVAVAVVVVVIGIGIGVKVRLQQHLCQQLVSQYLIEDVLFVVIRHTSQMFALTVVLDCLSTTVSSIQILF